MVGVREKKVAHLKPKFTASIVKKLIGNGMFKMRIGCWWTEQTETLKNKIVQPVQVPNSVLFMKAKQSCYTEYSEKHRSPEERARMPKIQDFSETINSINKHRVTKQV